MVFKVTEQVIEYDREFRVPWTEGGTWPHANRFGFHEAVVASYFILRGYEVLRHYVITQATGNRPLTDYSTRLVHSVIGEKLSCFFRHEMLEVAGKQGKGQPDLFVFREAYTNDPKMRYTDPRLWFFVEVKGPDERVNQNQLRFWRAVAERDDIGLGPERIRLYTAVPRGAVYDPRTIDY